MNRPLNVLVVEDSESVRTMLLTVLSRADPRVTTEGVVTLAQARARLEDAASVVPQGQRIDAVILDIHLPDADGIQAVEVLHAIAPSVPIVVLTGMTALDLEGATMNAGADDFVEKARLDVVELLRAVRKAAIRHAVRQKYEPVRQAVQQAQEQVKTDSAILKGKQPPAAERSE